MAALHVLWAGILIGGVAQAEMSVTVSGGYAWPISPIGQNSFSDKYQGEYFPSVDFQGGELWGTVWGAQFHYLQSFHKDFPTVTLSLVPLLATGTWTLYRDESEAWTVQAGLGPSFNDFKVDIFEDTPWTGVSLLAGTGLEWFLGGTWSIETGVSAVSFSPARSDQDWLGLLLFRGGLSYTF